MFVYKVRFKQDGTFLNNRTYSKPTKDNGRIYTAIGHIKNSISNITAIRRNLEIVKFELVEVEVIPFSK